MKSKLKTNFIKTSSNIPRLQWVDVAWVKSAITKNFSSSALQTLL